MENQEKLNNFQEKSSDFEFNKFEIQKEDQIIEGLIGEYQDWQKKLPINIRPEMVDLFLGNDGHWHWHLKSEYIKDEQKRKEYEAEKKNWEWW